MTGRKQNLLFLSALLAVLILLFSQILFTGKIIRAPDIINEFYWSVKGIGDIPLVDLFHLQLRAVWNIFINSGSSVEGGDASLSFLIWRQLIFWGIPAPASVAWFIVLHLFFGAAGAFFCCRAIGASRLAAFTGALIFALAPENASLINAGHVMKIATISYAPWAFYFLERGFQSRRVIFFLTTAFVLAFQFFNTHWQIAYYTCLCVGAYGVFRLIGIMYSEREEGKNLLPRLLGMNMVLLAFFLTTVSISLLPLSNWSKESNRGVQSGANQGKGGLDREEAMSWSLPPEETAAFVIPGFFGYSRQEAGENPSNIPSYYWGRMVFTQTLSYMGLLPWLLIPLPLIFRRDKYTWLAVIGLAGGVLFSMGKYTPVYNLLYDYFPGINRFRVPKMMMFIPVLAVGMLSARGIDLLMNADIREGRSFRRYLAGVIAVPVMLLLFLGLLQTGKTTWIQMFIENLAQPTRYEQGIQLIAQRWNNLMLETAITALLAALCAGAIALSGRMMARTWLVPCVLIMLYVGDVWRVNDKFMFLVDAPGKGRSSRTAVMEYIARDSNQYRTLPMDGSDPMHYASNRIPVLFTSNPVQQRRWQEFLDNLSINSSMTDMLNVKYLVYSAEQYAQDKAQLSDKYRPVFRSPDGQQILLENLAVLPKAWLAPTAIVTENRMQTLQLLQNAAFNPVQAALVESPPPITLSSVIQQAAANPGNVSVIRYEGERIELMVSSLENSLLVLGEKYYQGWKAFVDGRETDIYPVNHVLRGVYLTPGKHMVEYVFDPIPFKIGKYLTLSSFAVFAGMLIRELFLRRNRVKSEE